MEDKLEEEDGGGADMLMVEEEILEDSAVVDAVEDVMEVDGLDLEDTEGCVQVRTMQPFIPLMFFCCTKLYLQIA